MLLLPLHAAAFAGVSPTAFAAVLHPAAVLLQLSCCHPTAAILLPSYCSVHCCITWCFAACAYVVVVHAIAIFFAAAFLQLLPQLLLLVMLLLLHVLLLCSMSH